MTFWEKHKDFIKFFTVAYSAAFVFLFGVMAVQAPAYVSLGLLAAWILGIVGISAGITLVCYVLVSWTMK